MPAEYPGSPESSPKTGTVQTEWVRWSTAPGSLSRPKTYFVPSPVTTVQYSPLSSPLTAPVERVTREASSPSRCQRPVELFLTSLEDLPLRSTRVALSYFQHWSSESLCPSSLQLP